MLSDALCSDLCVFCMWLCMCCMCGVCCLSSLSVMCVLPADLGGLCVFRVCVCDLCVVVFEWLSVCGCYVCDVRYAVHGCVLWCLLCDSVRILCCARFCALRCLVCVL